MDSPKCSDQHVRVRNTYNENEYAHNTKRPLELMTLEAVGGCIIHEFTYYTPQLNGMVSGLKN